MSDKPCFVTVVFKGGERVSVWMEGATLDELTKDFQNNKDKARSYDLAQSAGSTSPAPSVLALRMVDVLFIA